MKRLATIDVGTNTTLLLVAKIGGGGDVSILEDKAGITRLGRGIGGDGRLGAEGIAATLAALATYAELARHHGAKIIAVGTEALRRAPNAQDFLAPAAAILGTPVEVIDGQREASLTFLAAARSFPAALHGDLLVLDIGGGSTEIVFARQGTIDLRTSLPLGSVRLTEKHVRHDPATAQELAAIRAGISPVVQAASLPAANSQMTIIGVAGTVTTLAAMIQGLASYDAPRVHGFRMTAAALAAQIDALSGSTQRQREAMAGLDPRRADVILAGACILQEIAHAVAAPEIVVSDRGVRWGLLYEVV